MLKFSRIFTSTCYPAGNKILHQCFSVLFMDNKKFDPAVYDVLISDLDDHDLHE